MFDKLSKTTVMSEKQGSSADQFFPTQPVNKIFTVQKAKKPAKF